MESWFGWIFNHLTSILINILLIFLSCLTESKPWWLVFFVHKCTCKCKCPLGEGGGVEPGSSESVQQNLHLENANYGSQQGSRFSERLIHKTPKQHPLLLLLPSLHIRQMRLTFTQLSTLQRREIYSASGRDWSQVSTWTSPHDDPVAQPWNEAGLQSNRGGNGERGRRRWLDSPWLFSLVDSNWRARGRQ